MDIEVIKEGLRKPGKSKKGLAEALGRQPFAVTALLKGERQLKASEIAVIEQYLELNGPISGEPSIDPSVVRVVGYVGASASAHFYPAGDLDEVDAPEGSTSDTVAVEIRGDSLGELFDRWLVFYDEVRRPITPDLIGKICVVGLADGRILIKKVKRGKDGLYTLVSAVEPPIENVAVEWAAKVKTMVPK